MDEIKQVSSTETSQMQSGHIIDNGKKIRKQDVSLEDVWKKLDHIQHRMEERMDKLEDKVEKIENNTKGPGGSQPNQKFTTSALHTEKAGQRILSELGKDIKNTVDDKGELEKNSFKRLMREHGWTAGTEKTYRNWMEKIAAHFDAFEYKVGERGGNNKASRIVFEGY